MQELTFLPKMWNEFSCFMRVETWNANGKGNILRNFVKQPSPISKEQCKRIKSMQNNTLIFLSFCSQDIICPDRKEN